jgi:hypothetical protein
METPKLAIGITPQPDFPVDDISEANATFVCLMLANNDIVTAGHQTAESLSWTFRAGHPAMSAAARRILTDQRQAEAFDHGISMFETMSALVKQDIATYSYELTVNVNAADLAVRMPEDDLREHIDTAHQRFVADMPHATQIIHEAVTRYFSHVGAYALYGAALARQFELDVAA